MHLLAYEMCGTRLTTLQLTCSCVRRCYSAGSTQSRPPPTKTTPATITKVPRKEGANWVRAPHPVSNLRLVEFVEKADESDAEKQLRAKQVEVQEWNHEFWSKHNTKFIQERKAFVASKTQEGKSNAISADEMSSFYKQFLDDNYREHIKYNREWYKKNVSLLLASVVTILRNISKMLKLKST